MEIQTTSDGTVTVGNELYAPWPNFGISGAPILNRRCNPKHLTWLLKTYDLFTAEWHRKMPQEIIDEILRYPEGHAELIELAQLAPDRFIRMSRRNPALTCLVAAYWLAYEWGHLPYLRDRNVRRKQLLESKHRVILQQLGLPERDEWVHILKKVPANLCYDFHIRNIIKLCGQPNLRRHLNYLPSINHEVSWLLRMEHPVTDAALLNLAATEPRYCELQITGIVASIIQKREMAVREPYWPYRGCIGTWKQLLAAEKRNALSCGLVSEQFPTPPVPLENVPEGLKLKALTSMPMIQAEASDMGNCILDFIDSVHLGQNYLYRIDAPERATVLLKLGRSCWELEEIGLRYNEGQTKLETELLVTRWIRENHTKHTL